MLKSKRFLKTFTLLFVFSLLFNGLNAQQFSWQKHTSNPQFASVRDIAIDQSTGTIYVLPELQQSIYYSEDDGETWESFPNNVALNPASIAFNSKTGDLLIADLLTALWWTDDKGENWDHEKFFTNPVSGFNAPLNHVEANPANGEVFISMVPDLTNPNRFGAIRMPQSMSSWDSLPISEVPVDYAFTSEGDIYIAAGGFDIGGNLGVYFSDDNGNSWTQLYDKYNGNICVNADDSVFIAGANGVKIYKPASNSWISRNTGLPGLPIRELEVNPVNNDLYVINSDGVVYYSENNGMSWAKLNAGITDRHAYTMKSNPNGKLFLGSLRSGFWRLNASQKLWARKVEGMGSGLSKVILESPEKIYGIQKHSYSGCVVYDGPVAGWDQRTEGMALDRSYDLVQTESGHIFGSFGTRLYHSSDEGTTWDSLQNVWQDPTAIYTLIEGLASENNNVYIKTSSSGGNRGDEVYRSTDNGQSWDKLFSMAAYNSNQSIPQDELFEVGNMLVSNGSDVYLRAKTMVGKDILLYMESETTSWVSIPSPDPGIGEIVLDNEGDLYTYSRFEGDLYYSSNNGQSWDTITNGGWGNLDVNYSMLHLRFDNNNNLYVAHENNLDGGGIWFRDNSGVWTDIGKSLPNTLNTQGISITASPMDVQFDKQNTPYILTTEGIYKYTGSTGITNEIAQTFGHVDLFPNPVKNQAQLIYHLQKPSDVRIMLLDISGKVLAHSMLPSRSKGDHEEHLDLSKLPDGTYFISLFVSGEKEVVKFVKQ